MVAKIAGIEKKTIRVDKADWARMQALYGRESSIANPGVNAVVRVLIRLHLNQVAPLEHEPVIKLPEIPAEFAQAIARLAETLDQE